jgi:hypothetical protein
MFKNKENRKQKDGSRRIKHSETFIDSINKGSKITGTLNKILKNTSPNRAQRDSRYSLNGYLSTLNFNTENFSDEEIKKKIIRNKNKLQFDREVRKLYYNPIELQSIDQPEYDDYLGYFFRQ